MGCGDALFFPALEAFGEPEGVEADDSIIDPAGPFAERIARQPFDQRFQPGRRYALITMLDVLEHLDQPAEALRHALSLLRADGLIVITVPAFMGLWTQHDDLNHHRTRYTRRTFARLADQSGLELIDVRYFFHWTCPVKLMIRFKERLIRSPPRPARVPISPLNRLMYAACLAEQTLIGRLQLPFGSSLLVVGRPQSRPGEISQSG